MKVSSTTEQSGFQHDFIMPNLFVALGDMIPAKSAVSPVAIYVSGSAHRSKTPVTPLSGGR